MKNFTDLHKFSRPELLELALTHKSYGNENADRQGAVTHNERLEFLGDAVLGAVLSAILMQDFPHDSEGQLSRRRASLVNEESLAAIARELGLHESLKLGKGEMKTGGREKPRILACSVEAWLGAIHQDAGYAAVQSVVETLFRSQIDLLHSSNLDYERDYKTRFQEWAHEKRSVSPAYEMAEEFGPAHARCFRVAAKLSGEVVSYGEGRSKKAAEQDAAQNALAKLTSMERAVSSLIEHENSLPSGEPESETHKTNHSHAVQTTGSPSLTTSMSHKETS